MSGIKVVAVCLVSLLIGAIIGFLIGPDGEKLVHVYYAQALPAAESSGSCRVTPDTITVLRGFNAELEIENLSGEKINVAFSNQIAVTNSNTIEKDLNPGDTFKVTLKTSNSGRFSYRVMGLGNPTCFSELPNPKIVIP